MSSVAVEIQQAKSSEKPIDSRKKEEEIDAKHILDSTLPRGQFNVRHEKEGKSGMTQISGMRKKIDKAV